MPDARSSQPRQDSSPCFKAGYVASDSTDSRRLTRAPSVLNQRRDPGGIQGFLPFLGCNEFSGDANLPHHSIIGRLEHSFRQSSSGLRAVPLGMLTAVSARPPELLVGRGNSHQLVLRAHDADNV